MRAGGVLRETLLVFRHQMRLLSREPLWAALSLVQPVLYLTLFGPLLKPLAGGPGFPVDDAWQIFVPGLLVQLGIFGTLYVGFGLRADMRFGVMERMRVTPASRLSLLLGRVLRDVCTLLAQALLLLLTAVALGLRASVEGSAAVLALIACVAVALSSFSYAVAMSVRSEEMLALALNGISLPVTLLSGILLPLTLAPGWLRALAAANPFSHLVEGARAAFRGDLGARESVVAAVVGALLAAAALFLGTRTFKRGSS